MQQEHAICTLPSYELHRPVLVKTIFEKIQEINRELGMTIRLVEQNAHLACRSTLTRM